MQAHNKNWHRLSLEQTAAQEVWTVVWDTKHRPESDVRNRAVEKSESAARDRAKHLLRMGFVVYEIRDPKGLVVMSEAKI